MAQEVSFRDIQISSDEIEIRKIGLRDLWESLKEGYDDFNAKPSYGLFLILIYPVFALLADRKQPVKLWTGHTVLAAPET